MKLRGGLKTIVFDLNYKSKTTGRENMVSRFLEWWLQAVAVVMAVAIFIIAKHARNTIDSHEAKIIGQTGDEGPQGFLGPRGIIGIVGLQGPTGITGPTGLTGPLGPLGMTATSGPTGPQGVAGFVGPFGPATFTGPTGATGFTGLSSTVGRAGPTGDLLAQGLTGPTGPTGSPILPFVLASYTMPAGQLTSAQTTFAAPLVRNGHMHQTRLVNYQQAAFSYDEGIVRFVQSASPNLTFNVRISIAGSIIGGQPQDYARILFSTLPISPNGGWIVGASWATGASAHLFSSTLIDTVSPSAIAWGGDLTFQCFSSGTTLNVSSLSVEIAQLSL